MAFSVTSSQPPQKRRLYFDKDDWAGCHSEFWVFNVKIFNDFIAILRTPSWIGESKLNFPSNDFAGGYFVMIGQVVNT